MGLQDKLDYSYTMLRCSNSFRNYYYYGDLCTHTIPHNCSYLSDEAEGIFERIDFPDTKKRWHLKLKI